MLEEQHACWHTGLRKHSLLSRCRQGGVLLDKYQSRADARQDSKAVNCESLTYPMVATEGIVVYNVALLVHMAKTCQQRQCMTSFCAQLARANELTSWAVKSCRSG